MSTAGFPACPAQRLHHALVRLARGPAFREMLSTDSRVTAPVLNPEYLYLLATFLHGFHFTSYSLSLQSLKYSLAELFLRIFLGFTYA